MAPKVPDHRPEFTDASGVRWQFDAEITAWVVKHNTESGKLTHVAVWVSADAEGKRRFVALLNGKPLFDASTTTELQQRLLVYRTTA